MMVLSDGSSGADNTAWQTGEMVGRVLVLPEYGAPPGAAPELTSLGVRGMVLTLRNNYTGARTLQGPNNYIITPILTVKQEYSCVKTKSVRRKSNAIY
jgi:hypothetical protein